MTPPPLQRTAGEQRRTLTAPSRGRPFRPGQSGNPRGRPRGVPNTATREIQEAARRLLKEPAYVASLRRRLIAGKAPHMETLLHHYAFGRPTEGEGAKVTIEGDVFLSLRWPDGHPVRPLARHQAGEPPTVGMEIET